MTIVRGTFTGGTTGPWKVTAQTAVRGAGLGAVSRLRRDEGPAFVEDPAATWTLTGVRSTERYTTRTEHDALVAIQAPLGRVEAVCGVLIPITKSAAWWALSQDERRAVLEDQSHHIALGAKYLPAIARRLYHGRDLGSEFDFLTWFEFAPNASQAFDDLLGALRSTPEWTFVEREVELRVSLEPTA